ncbi:hypothetical protein AAG570_008540 [Ranatra chinensis]|uniref:Uncharacterized protein n=1 Tax=Ranatra chinensis TaxID=642074 RepID=A0ABD0Z1X8_9HEMI
MTTPSSASAGTRSKSTATTSASATTRPPPIHVFEGSDFEGLCYSLEALVGSDGFTCRSRVHDIVIAPSTPDGYRVLIRYLAENNVSYHTYQLQSERSYRVVMRGLNHCAPVGRIRTDIENLGRVAQYSVPGARSTSTLKATVTAPRAVSVVVGARVLDVPENQGNAGYLCPLWGRPSGQLQGLPGLRAPHLLQFTGATSLTSPKGNP